MSPLTLLTSGYRWWGQIEWTHHFGSAGTAGRLGILLKSAKFLRFRASSRALGHLENYSLHPFVDC